MHEFSVGDNDDANLQMEAKSFGNLSIIIMYHLMRDDITAALQAPWVVISSLGIQLDAVQVLRLIGRRRN